LSLPAVCDDTAVGRMFVGCLTGRDTDPALLLLGLKRQIGTEDHMSSKINEAYLMIKCRSK
jgi:hypothetical protein